MKLKITESCDSARSEQALLFFSTRFHQRNVILIFRYSHQKFSRNIPYAALAIAVDSQGIHIVDGLKYSVLSMEFSTYWKTSIFDIIRFFDYTGWVFDFDSHFFCYIFFRFGSLEKIQAVAKISYLFISPKRFHQME